MALLLQLLLQAQKVISPRRKFAERARTKKTNYFFKKQKWGTTCRRVGITIHEQHFSPNNCAVFLDPSAPFASFFLLCVRGNRRILTFHVVPIARDVSRRLDEILHTATHLEVVLASLEEEQRFQQLRGLGASLSAIVKPYLGF